MNEAGSVVSLKIVLFTKFLDDFCCEKRPSGSRGSVEQEPFGQSFYPSGHPWKEISLIYYNDIIESRRLICLK